MPMIEISDELYRRLKAFVKVIDAVLGEKISDRIDDYAAFVLSVGLERMLLDPLPKEEALQRTMVEMFRRNPEFVCDFVAEMIERGRRIREEEVRRIREEWEPYFT